MRKSHFILVFALVVAGMGGWLVAETPGVAAPEAASAALEEAPAAASPAGAVDQGAACGEQSDLGDLGALAFLPAPNPKGCIPCTIGQPPRCPNCGLGNPGVCNGTCCECLN